MFGGHTACGGKNAHRAARKDLQQEFSHLILGETEAQVHDRGKPVAISTLLQSFDQLSAMDGGRKVDHDAHLVPFTFATRLCRNAYAKAHFLPSQQNLPSRFLPHIPPSFSL